MKVCLDLDGVLVDFMAGAHKFHNIEYDYNEYPYELGLWDTVPPPTSDMSTRDFWDALTADFWAGLEWMPDGRCLLRELEERFGAKNICIVTAPTKCPECVVGKIRWITEHLPDYSRRFFIGPDKRFFASDGALLVDDADHNVDSFRCHGGKAVLVPRKWNANHALSNTSLSYTLSQIGKKHINSYG